MRLLLARPVVAALTGPLVLLVPPGGAADLSAEVTSAPGAQTTRAGTVEARWQWPLAPAPPRVLRPFAAPRGPYGPGHRGADLDASVGTSVLAVEDGTITHAGRVAGRGTVTVSHRDRLSSTYEPVRADVTVGRTVAAGDVLGVLETSPRSHCPPAACLHLGARRSGRYLDPLLLLGSTRVRLLPLGSAHPITG